MIPRTIEGAHTDLLDRGYVDVDEVTCRRDTLRVGARVRNRGEQYSEALRRGTGVVRALTEKPDSPWSHKYGERDIELVVETDKDRLGNGNRVGLWANYHTVVIGECYWCNVQVAADGSCGCDGERGAPTAPWAMDPEEHQ